MKKWFVAHTQPRQELIAQQHLRQQGFEVYLPRFKKITRHARKMTETLAPLFPRYLFIGIDNETQRWRSINGTRGICYVLTQDNQPALIAENILTDLKSQEDITGALPLDSMALFAKGDNVRILEGAFAGQTAIFEKMDDQHRVQLLLNFLGRDMQIYFPLYAVEAA